MPHSIRHLNHWRPLHDPWTFTADGQYPERLSKADRRKLKKQTKNLLKRIDLADEQLTDSDHL